jgi:hypothetical protein
MNSETKTSDTDRTRNDGRVAAVAEIRRNNDILEEGFLTTQTRITHILLVGFVALFFIILGLIFLNIIELQNQNKLNDISKSDQTFFCASRATQLALLDTQPRSPLISQSIRLQEQAAPNCPPLASVPKP